MSPPSSSGWRIPPRWPFVRPGSGAYRLADGHCGKGPSGGCCTRQPGFSRDASSPDRIAHRANSGPEPISIRVDKRVLTFYKGRILKRLTPQSPPVRPRYCPLPKGLVEPPRTKGTSFAEILTKALRRVGITPTKTGPRSMNNGSTSHPMVPTPPASTFGHPSPSQASSAGQCPRALMQTTVGRSGRCRNNVPRSAAAAGPGSFV